jgi:hypothetical protein
MTVGEVAGRTGRPGISSIQELNSPEGNAKRKMRKADLAICLSH